MTKILAYCDSLCEPNPGKMEAGIWAKDETETILFIENVPMGRGTCNQAEYFALLNLLTRLQTHLGEQRPTIIIHSDSQLMTKQVNGLWKVTKSDIKHLYKKVMDLKSALPFEVRWIPRENNAMADALAQQNRLKGSGRQAMMEDGWFKAKRYTPCVELLSDKEMASILKNKKLIAGREHLEDLLSASSINFEEVQGTIVEMQSVVDGMYTAVPKINNLADKWIASTFNYLASTLQDFLQMAKDQNKDIILAYSDFFHPISMNLNEGVEDTPSTEETVGIDWDGTNFRITV